MHSLLLACDICRRIVSHYLYIRVRIEARSELRLCSRVLSDHDSSFQQTLFASRDKTTDEISGLTGAYPSNKNFVRVKGVNTLVKTVVQTSCF